MRREPDAGFQDIMDRKKGSARFHSNTHRIDGNVGGAKNVLKQNTFRQQPMQSKNKQEPTHITAGQFMLSDGRTDGGMTTIRSQAPVQYAIDRADRFRNGSSKVQDEEEKIEESPLMGNVRAK